MPTRRSTRSRKTEAGTGTRCVHGGVPPGSGPAAARPAGEPVTVPVEQSTTFRFRSPQEMIDVFLGRRPGYLYSRYDNPTLAAVERKLAALEGTPRALLFSSGMAAISTALLHLCRPGDLVLAARDLYGGTQAVLTQILPRYGVRVERAPLEDEAALRRALAHRPKVFYFESPTNPCLQVPDGPRLCRLAREAGALTVFDSTFGTPVLQHPARWGVDVVLHSATKYLGGHHDLTCGVLAGEAERIELLGLTRRLLGGVPEAWTAFLLDRGLKTLEVRVLRASETALALARELEAHPRVARVHYPGLASHPQHERAARLMEGGFGAVLAFELRGGRRGAVRFMEGLRWIQLATSLGGVETLVSHPATSSHQGLTAAERREQGITEGLLRLSVGLESPGDLWADLERGLDRL